MVLTNDRIKLVSLEILCGTKHQPPKAELELDIDGEVKCTGATGDGPVDAAFNGIKALFVHEASLQLYQVHAVSEGTDAQAEVTVLPPVRTAAKYVPRGFEPQPFFVVARC